MPNRREGLDPAKWDPVIALQVYELVRAGYTRKKIAEYLNISCETLKKWHEKHELLREAVRMGKNFHKGGSTQSYMDYVYQRLPEDLQEVFDEIEDCRKAPSVFGRLEHMMKDKGRRGRQHLFLHALVKHNFDMSQACSMVNIPVSTLKQWMLTDYKFAELVKEFEFHKKNFFESALIQLVKEGNPAAVLFANRTVNRDRGYAEKQEVHVSGEVQHQHNLIDLSELDLDVETQKKVLEAIRRKNQKVKQADALLPQYRVKGVFEDEEPADGPDGRNQLRIETKVGA